MVKETKKKKQVKMGGNTFTQNIESFKFVKDFLTWKENCQSISGDDLFVENVPTLYDFLFTHVFGNIREGSVNSGRDGEGAREALQVIEGIVDGSVFTQGEAMIINAMAEVLAELKDTSLDPKDILFTEFVETRGGKKRRKVELRGHYRTPAYEKKTGKKPYYFLDNMTKLSTIDENKAQDWNPFLNWGTDLKHKGFSGMFVHHANKGNEKKGSSGSSTIGRLLDTSIQLTKLDPEYRFDIPGQKSLQSSIEFDKSRGFGGSEWSKKRIITMNEGGEWKHYPYLKQVSFKILQLANSGLTQSEIREMGKNKEIAEEGKPPLSSSSVDRLYLELVKLGLIKKQIRQTHCWSCRKKIETNKDPDCTKCQFGIKCGSCGSCWCEKPKEEKHEDNDY